MTDETRAELRRGIALLVVESSALDTTRGYVELDEQRQRSSLSVFVRDESAGRRPLTTAQQLALSVLLGDESVLPQALADYLLDQGHEYAVECYERGKRDGNPLLAMADGYAEACRELNRQIAGAVAAPQSVAE